MCLISVTTGSNKKSLFHEPELLICFLAVYNSQEKSTTKPEDPACLLAFNLIMATEGHGVHPWCRLMGTLILTRTVSEGAYVSKQ